MCRYEVRNYRVDAATDDIYQLNCNLCFLLQTLNEAH